jgi:hypothetical protein
MSKIFATDDFQTQNWTITIEDLQSNYTDLFIGFTDESPVIEFKNLQFKYELKHNNEIQQQGSYPPPNVKYLNSDQVYLVVERLNLSPETTYELYLWAENDGNSFEKTFEFITQRPEQPYSSWTWNGEIWEAPATYPEGGGSYVWDEENQEWDLMVFEGT